MTRGVGVDALPDFIRTSDILTGNNLGQLGNCEKIPTPPEVAVFLASVVPQEGGSTAFAQFEREHEYEKMLGVAIRATDTNLPQAARLAMTAAKCALDNGDVSFGWKAALVALQFAR